MAIESIKIARTCQRVRLVHTSNHWIDWCHNDDDDEPFCRERMDRSPSWLMVTLMSMMMSMMMFDDDVR